ncbi:MAG TPA: TolC family protein [Gemmataceae bacterium]|nr:TolC family protein [Gemmataceae bacterium]
MRVSRSVWRRVRSLTSLAAPVLFTLSGGLRPPLAALAAEPPPAATVTASAPVVAQVFDLHSCREYAVEHQPAVAAARAALTAAQLKAEALDNLHGLPALLARDLPIRRQQACLGVEAAQAELNAAEWDARYSATYCYLAALYALEQQRTAQDILKKPLGLDYLRDTVDTIVKNGSRKDVTEKHKVLVRGYIALVSGRQAEADQGYERAIAALREALNIAPGCPIELADKVLPRSDAVPDRAQVVELAVARRGEVALATIAEQVLCLEVDAQGRLLLPSARTFASGSDIHARVLPAAQYDPDYKPGPVGPEMPANLIGSRRERQDQAGAYHARGEAVTEKTRNLIALETEDAYLRWAQYDTEAKKLTEAAGGFAEFADAQSQKFDPQTAGYPTVDDVLNAQQKATQVRIEAVEARFRRLAVLANLERLTAGAFCSGLEAPVVEKPKQ